MTPLDNELGELGTSVHDALPDISAQQAARQRAAFLRSEDVVNSPSSMRAPWQWGLAALAVLVILVGGTLLLSRPRPQVVASSSWSLPDVSQPVVATQFPGAAPAVPVLKDPRALESTTKAMVLESGRLDIAAGEARKIVAGPYLLTSGPDSGFALTWDPEAETLTVDVNSGEVTLVRASSQHVVVAGDFVRGTAEDFVVVHTSSKRRAPEVEETKTVAAAWVRAAKRGEYRDALALAEAARALESLRSLGRKDLKLLADSARLGGGAAKGEPVLLELRRRFPKSTDAKRAAFYLGRFSESAGRYDDAILWYREYVESSGGGSFGAQARGRLVLVLSREGTSGEAAIAARDYLAHHPKGPYAPLASRLADSSSSGVP